MAIRVKCIDTGGNTDLVKGREYEVYTEHTYNYVLVGSKNAYLKKLFVEVSAAATVAAPAPIFVRCIDQGNGSMLTLGKVYQVGSEDSIRYYLKEFVGVGNGFSKHRFEVVKQPTAPSSPVKTTIKDVLADIEEERLRNLLKPRRLPGECACGIVQSMCDYHR